MSRKKKNSNNLSIELFQPLNEVQRDVLESYSEGYQLMLHGTAGTGKTYCALNLALNDVINERKRSKVVVIRSAVPSRDMGFAPGSIEEKAKLFEGPYSQISNAIFKRGDAYSILKTKGILDFLTTSYIRGKTFNNCFIVVDEIQNMNFEELNTIITRIGKNCKIIFCGDTNQTDLNKKYDKSGLSKFFEIIEDMESFDIIEFTALDIVRSGLVKEYILAKENLENI